MRWRVPRRVDGNKQRLNGLGLAGRTERVERKRHRLQLSGADVRTMGIAEIDQEELAAEIRVSAAPPAVIGEIEWPANRLTPLEQCLDERGGRGISGILRACRHERAKQHTRQGKSCAHAPTAGPRPVVGPCGLLSVAPPPVHYSTMI